MFKMKKIRWLFLLFFLLNSYTQLIAEERKQILIINSYHKGFQWSDILIGGIEEVFNQESKIDLTILYMDSKRIASPSYYQSLLDSYKIQLKNRKYDLIIPIDRFAYDFTAQNYHELFQDEPLIVAGLEQFSQNMLATYGLQDKVSVVFEKRAIDDIMHLITKVMPKLTKLYIINDKSLNGDDTNHFTQKVIDDFDGKFEIEYIREGTAGDFINKFNHYKPNEAIFFVRYYNGSHDQFYKNFQIEEMIDQFEIPVFVTDALFMRKGPTGGKLLSIKQIGIDTGLMALEYFKEPFKTPKMVTSQSYEYVFDYKKMQKFNLHVFQTEIPYKYINNPIPFFEKYRKMIDAVFLASPFFVILIFILIYNIYKRIRSENELKIIEIEKNKHQQFVIQQSKLAEIGEIFSSIAHQWKNPLVEITALVQRHAYSFSKVFDEKSDKYINDIMVQVRYMSDTIDDFQKFIMPSTKKAIFDVNEAVETMMNIIHHNIKYSYIDVVIEKKNNSDLIVLGYKNEFMQTLLNIVNNAKDQIKIAQENQKIKRGHILIMMSNDEQNNILIVIEDNAGGIPNDKLPYIFDAYFTTKEKGHGIGLYMSKVILENNMNGKIKAENTAEGARFTITLENGKNAQ